MFQSKKRKLDLQIYVAFLFFSGLLVTTIKCVKFTWYSAVKLSSTVHCRISGKFYALYTSNKYSTKNKTATYIWRSNFRFLLWNITILDKNKYNHKNIRYNMKFEDMMSECLLKHIWRLIPLNNKSDNLVVYFLMSSLITCTRIYLIVKKGKIFNTIRRYINAI